MSNGKPMPPNASTRGKAAFEGAIDKLARRVKDLRTFDISGIEGRWDPRIEGLQKRINATLADILGEDTPDYKQHVLGPLDSALDPNVGDRLSLDEIRQGIRESLDQAIGKLNAVKKLLTDRFEGKAVAEPAPAPAPAPAVPPPPPASPPASPPAPAPVPAPAPAPPPEPTPTPMPAQTPATTAVPAAAPAASSAPAPAAQGASARRVAIVCRQGDAFREAASGLVARLGLEAVFLGDSQEAAAGSFIERLDALRDVDYAVVLLAADAPTQAILLEIGFLLGAVGRSRICCLGGKPAPEWDGLVRHPMDDAGVWRLLLAREMRQAGLNVDLNRAL